MHAKPMISLAVTKGLIEAIAGKGCSPGPILREFGLEHSNLADPEGFIATETFALLLEETARATGDDYFGLHFGAGINPKNIGPVIYVVLNSPTIGAGIDNVERYLPTSLHSRLPSILASSPRRCDLVARRMPLSSSARFSNGRCRRPTLSSIKFCSAI